MERIFKNNPRLDVCYKTSDDKFFFTPNDAHNYAANLEDKSVEKLIRPLKMEVKELLKSEERKEVNIPKISKSKG